MNIETVLEEYRKGDESRRLSLFLAFRELRELFEQIEQESSHEGFMIRFPWSRRHLPKVA
jgi:hypothetical protein